VTHQHSDATRQKIDRAHAYRGLPKRSAKLPRGFTAEQLADFELAISGYLVVPRDETYETARQHRNPAFQRAPQVIAYCQTEADIAIALRYAALRDLPFTVRAGAHHTAGYSVNDDMVIDVSLMNNVFVDRETLIAHVGPGCTVDRLTAHLADVDGHVPVSPCGSVCIAGFAMGGGYGYTSRTFGMHCDSVIAFRVMFADGTVVVASSSQHRDLFWALRGAGGGQFGIVLQITYQLHRANTTWALAIAWDATYAAAALQTLQRDFMRGSSASAALGYTTHLANRDANTTQLALGVYSGERSAGLQTIKNLLAIPTAQLLIDHVADYRSAVMRLTDLHDAQFDVPADLAKRRISCYVDQAVNTETWQALLHHLQTVPTPWCKASIEPYGGVIETISADATAFVHRNVDFNFVVDTAWRNSAEQRRAVTWLDAAINIIKPFANEHVYQNYADSRLVHWAEAYYGSALPRLQHVKNTYDPGNVFRFAQSITASVD
jgi:FAD/FMN-containing dehydrogenase